MARSPLLPVCRLCISGALLLAFSLALAAAEEPPPSAVESTPPVSSDPPPPPADIDIPAVVIIEGRRRRLVAPPQNPTRFVTQVELGEATGSLDSISAELEKTVGVTVRRLGGLGSYSTLSIRGSTAQQVEVYWDGVLLNRADSGLTNLEDIPMDLIERIEIYRGAAPAQFGAAGIGGVVNLITRRPPGRARGTGAPASEAPRPFGLVSLTAGSWDTWKFDTMIGGPVDDKDGLFFYHRLQSHGNFDYENDNGTPLNPNDDRTERRVNNDFVAQDFFGRLIGPLSGDWQWSALLDVFDKEQGLAGLAAVQARRARLHTSRAIFALRVEAPASADAAAPSPAFGLNLLYEEVRFRDPQSELSLAAADDLTVTSSVAATAQAGSVLRPQAVYLGVFGEVRHEESRSTYHLPSITHGPVQSRDALTGVVQAEFRWFQERLRLVPTLRGAYFFNRLAGDPRVITPAQWGENHSTLALLNPSLGISFAPWPDLEFKANAGRFHRVPTLVELFGHRGGVVGAANLAPEQADTFDIGFQALPPLPQALGRFEMEYAFFYTRTENLIALVRNSQNTSIATNIGTARNLGHELTLHWDTFDPWAGGLWPSLQFNYTHQDPRDAGDVPFLQGNYLPNQPVDSWFLRAELAWQSEPPPATAPAVPSSRTTAARSLSLWGEYAYDGETFRDRANLFLVEARPIVNAGLKWREPTAAGEFSLGLEVKNLTDNRVTDVAQFPLPGRSLFGTGQWKF